MSKGSAQRPRSITQDDYEKRWDYIFSRDQDPEPVVQKHWGESPNIDIRKVEESTNTTKAP
jgi:3-methyladenine DNA glycosylase/8-oxoguanine DNA glycosylase